MRLVAAIWNDHYPFDALNGVNDYYTTEYPEDLRQGDVLIVHGGEDISPTLYGRGPSTYTHARATPSWRDTTEWNLMERAVELGVPILGICRGAQMLCALAGGFLIQHVNNHSGSHMVHTFDGKNIRVNSIHHQMMYPFEVDHEVVAWCAEHRSDVHYDVNRDIHVPQEVEFVYFPTVKGFAIQWHPEMMGQEEPANHYVLNYIDAKLKEINFAMV